MGNCSSVNKQHPSNNQRPVNNQFPVINERSGPKGMINLNAIAEYSSKAKKAVCEVIIPGGGFGSGFFCKIPYTENDNLLLPVLITCNHVFNRDLITSKDIKIIRDGKTKTIPLKRRKKWTDMALDFTCIEIKEKEDKIHTFFNLDDNVLDKNCSNDYYLNKKVIIYGINQNDNNQIGFSNGVITECKYDSFSYTCDTYPGCSGGCIVNQYNNNVIGIHLGAIENTDLNAGRFIRQIIKYLKNNKETLSNVSKS